MTDVSTEIIAVGTAILGITAAVLAAGFGLNAIKFGSKWAMGLFKSISR